MGALLPELKKKKITKIGTEHQELTTTIRRGAGGLYFCSCYPAAVHGSHTLPAQGLSDNQPCQAPGCVNYSFMANSAFLPWNPLCCPLLASFLRDMVPSMAGYLL